MFLILISKDWLFNQLIYQLFIGAIKNNYVLFSPDTHESQHISGKFEDMYPDQFPDHVHLIDLPSYQDNPLEQKPDYVSSCLDMIWI